jgi:hypothetical protein
MYLPIDRLAELTSMAKEVADYKYGAARVSLTEHHRESPTTFKLIRHPQPEHVTSDVQWEPPDEKLANGFQPNERIEQTAECIGLATLVARDDLRAWARSEHKGGGDWLVLEGADGNPDDAILVELSGVDEPGQEKEIYRRLALKVGQLVRGKKKSQHEYERGLAVVVGVGQGVVVTQAVDLAAVESSEDGK